MVAKAELTHDILKYVSALEKGKPLGQTDAVGCAKLILKLESERRRLTLIAESAEAVIAARENDWKELLRQLQSANTSLRSAIKDMAKSMKANARRQDEQADKWLNAAEAFKSENRTLRLPK